MPSECALNEYQISHECQSHSWQNEIRMLANILMDIDQIHSNGHMDSSVFGAIVSLVATHMDRIAQEATSNA